MSNNKKILVVEDDIDINSLITYNMQKDGFSVEQVFDGNQARDRLREEKFDTVILDIMLPGVDGFSICRDLKNNPDSCRTFVVMVSAKGEPQDKLYAHILGADYYLTKPFSIETLMRVVRELNLIADKDFLVKVK
jgi:DNA-binding response OmpR family regulator